MGMTSNRPSILHDIYCPCKPWQQSWRAETPGVCATCGWPFKTYSRAREVCLKTEGCLLLPDHEGECDV